MAHLIYQKLKLKNMIFLSNKMLLSLKLLNTNSLDLEEEINDIVSENPFLEAETILVPTEYKNVKKKDVVDDYDIDNYEVQSQSLRSYLIDQFYALNNDDKSQERIFIYLLDMLDEHGFITLKIEEIANDMKMPIENVKKVLDILKSLDPPGIGSADVAEALDRQTEDLNVKKLIGLIEIISKNTSEAFKKSGLSQKEFDCALLKMKNLNPYPANGFYESSYTPYVEPDIFIVKKDEEYDVIVNDRIDLRFSSLELYEKLIKSDNKDYVEFVKLKYNQAKNLIESFLKRRETLLKFGKIIAEREKDFFNKGKPVPLKVSWIAAALDVSPSTVTRIISSKYVKTPNGIYPLHFFFERFIYKGGNGELSRNDIKTKISEYISKENKKSPLTDEKIGKMLVEMGIKISRRVIVKYREELGIQSSSKRKQL